MTTVQVWDEAAPGDRSRGQAVVLDCPRVTVRDLIRNRVRQEVARYNQSVPAIFCGLVQPDGSEQVLNGYRMNVKRPLDWEAQFYRACSSFENGNFRISVNGRSIASLDAEVEMFPGSTVEFIKHMPLIAG